MAQHPPILSGVAMKAMTLCSSQRINGGLSTHATRIARMSSTTQHRTYIDHKLVNDKLRLILCCALSRAETAEPFEVDYLGTASRVSEIAVVFFVPLSVFFIEFEWFTDLVNLRSVLEVGNPVFILITIKSTRENAL